MTCPSRRAQTQKDNNNHMPTKGLAPSASASEHCHTSEVPTTATGAERTCRSFPDTWSPHNLCLEHLSRAAARLLVGLCFLLSRELAAAFLAEIDLPFLFPALSLQSPPQYGKRNQAQGNQDPSKDLGRVEGVKHLDIVYGFAKEVAAFSWAAGNEFKIEAQNEPINTQG
mmetsp:Transcript_20198/g.30243  ORF Transcript_20198/g.30243 Transcript_20198/m.30243 type:complete len:170 (-) Transcript_20198:1-510(-)